MFTLEDPARANGQGRMVPRDQRALTSLDDDLICPWNVGRGHRDFSFEFFFFCIFTFDFAFPGAREMLCI